MMLSHLGEDAAAERVEQAIVHVLSKKLESMQAGKMGYSTSEVGDLVAALVADPVLATRSARPGLRDTV